MRAWRQDLLEAEVDELLGRRTSERRKTVARRATGAGTGSRGGCVCEHPGFDEGGLRGRSIRQRAASPGTPPRGCGLNSLCTPLDKTSRIGRR